MQGRRNTTQKELQRDWIKKKEYDTKEQVDEFEKGVRGVGGGMNGHMRIPSPCRDEWDAPTLSSFTGTQKAMHKL